LVFLRARYLAPWQGRFLSRDTWPGDFTRPLSLNQWNYSLSNPVNYTDPSGKNPQSLWALCILLIAGDLALPVGDAACVALVAGAGLLAIGTLIYAARNAPDIPICLPDVRVYPDSRLRTGENPFNLPYLYRAPEPEPESQQQPKRPGPDIIVLPTPTDNVRLYHGTRSPASSFATGIDVSLGDGQFGPGFYTTLDKETAKWFALNYAKGSSPAALTWADVPRQWISEARRLTRDEYDALTYGRGSRWSLPIPESYGYLLTNYDIIYGPIAGLERWTQYKFNPTPTATTKVNSVTWHYEPVVER
jgi:hypothetical protein